MTSKKDAIDLARKLLLLSIYNDNANERRASHAQAVKIAQKHDISQTELLGAATAAAWSIDDVMKAADRGKEVVAIARAALADPEVQKTVTALRDLGSGIAKGIGALRKAKKA